MLQGFGLVAIIEASTGDDYCNGFKFVHRANHSSPELGDSLLFQHQILVTRSL